MILDDLLEILNGKLLETDSRPLNVAEIIILRGIWQYQTYSEMAQAQGYSVGYFTNVVAPELCRRLSTLVGRQVTKKNCRAVLENYFIVEETPKTLAAKGIDRVSSPVSQELSPSYPSGSVPLDSPYYIERSPFEEQVYQEICKPGALIRIKAPSAMGKTSLLSRVLDYASGLGYRTVSLNLEQVDREILSDVNRFLRWLCANATRQLQLEPCLDDYWDEDIGSKVSCSLYFRGYLLEKIDSPLILAFDEVNQLFEHPQVAQDVLPLLRSWYEEAKRLPLWQKLRQIVVHSTEIYVPLNLNQSPFNVGLPIQLSSFTLLQVQILAQRYQLDWFGEEEAKQLINLVGGHPALVHIALYHLNRGDITLAQLLETAWTSNGIYQNHLQRHWATLQEQPELALALEQIMTATEPVHLDPTLAYKLSSMGLIQASSDKAIPSCELYRRYFNYQF